MTRKIIFIAGVIIVCFGIQANGQQTAGNTAEEDRGKELGYLYAFSEATKMFIFGDYARAANLYRECLKYEPGSGAINYQLAELYLKAGDLKTAHQYSHKAYLANPENKWYTIQMANIYQAEQKFDSAIVIYRTLLNGSDADIRIYYQIASLLEKKGAYREALDNLNLIESKAGISRETVVSKSRIYDRLGMKKEAISQLKKALDGREEDYIIYGMMAEFYRTHHNIDSAEYFYKKVIGEHQEDQNLMLSYGEFLLEQKRITEARNLYAGLFNNDKIDENVKYNYLYTVIQNQDFFNRVKPVMDTVIKVLIRNYPEDMRVMSLYSDVNYRLGNFNAASRMLKKIMNRDENNFTAWEQFLFCQSAMDKPDSVIYYGEEAISKFDKRPIPYLLVSSVYYTKKEYSKAIGLLKQGEDLAETESLKIEFYALLAECYSKVADTKQSDKYYESALVIDSTNIAILNNYAYSLAERGESIKKAEAMSKYVIDREPFNATYLDTYAWIMYKDGNYSEANKYIKKAIQYGGNQNAEVLYHYGDILLKRGKSRKALAMFSEALKRADEDLKEELSAKIKGLSKGVL